MGRQVTVEGVEEVPADVSICHYDELDEDAKERFPELVEGRDACVDDRIAAGLNECDLVKFTAYYRVTVR